MLTKRTAVPVAPSTSSTQRVSSGHPIIPCVTRIKTQYSRHGDRLETLRTQDKVCEVCGKRLAIHKCGICGRNVCEKHFDKRKGICSVCSDLMCQVCGKRLSVDACIVCGRLICRSCSVELQPGIRVCTPCYENLPEVLSERPELSYLLRYIRKRH